MPTLGIKGKKLERKEKYVETIDPAPSTPAGEPLGEIEVEVSEEMAKRLKLGWSVELAKNEESSSPIALLETTYPQELPEAQNLRPCQQETLPPQSRAQDFRSQFFAFSVDKRFQHSFTPFIELEAASSTPFSAGIEQTEKPTVYPLSIFTSQSPLPSTASESQTDLLPRQERSSPLASRIATFRSLSFSAERKLQHSFNPLLKPHEAASTSLTSGNKEAEESISFPLSRFTFQPLLPCDSAPDEKTSDRPTISETTVTSPALSKQTRTTEFAPSLKTREKAPRVKSSPQPSHPLASSHLEPLTLKNAERSSQEKKKSCSPIASKTSPSLSSKPEQTSELSPSRQAATQISVPKNSVPLSQSESPTIENISRSNQEKGNSDTLIASETIPTQPSLFRSRSFAALIDISVACSFFVLGLLLFPDPPRVLPFVFAVFYLLTKDSLGILNGQSIGKKFMRLRVVNQSHRSLAGNYKAGLMRNLSWLFAPIEFAILYVREDEPNIGKRLGDDWAHTEVIVEKKALPRKSKWLP